jgi:putative ABC transport system ATP-binding protein
VIEVRDAKKWIQNGARRVEILKGISLVIPAGQFAAIMGASGSGKSTLLGLLAGLDTPSSGEIWLDGVPIHNLAEAELAAVRGSKIGFVFQSYQLIATLTALENVLLPHELNVAGSGLKQARRLLDEVGLKGRMDHYPVQLSGGEQQRVALARAFVVEPPIVMADEPTGNLDSVNGRMVLDLLLKRNRETGTTLVLVTHDPEVASRADRKIVLRDGLVVEDTLPFAGPNGGAGWRESAASESLILHQNPDSPPSGAKAPGEVGGLMYGLKPVPFTGLSLFTADVGLSAACLAKRAQNG